MVTKRIKKVRGLDIRPIYKVYVLRRTDKMDEHEPDQYQPLYFGKGKDKRELYHRGYALRTINKGGRRRLVYVMIYKLWREEFDFIEEVLFDNLTEQEAILIECEMIAKYGRLDIGTGILANHTNGGDGVSGATWKLNEENKNNISKGNKGKPKSEEHKKNLSRAKKGKPAPNKGKPMSEKQKQKLRDSHTGKELSEEHKNKIRETLLANHPMRGKHWPEEVLAKLRGPRGPHKNPRKSKYTTK